MVYYSSIELEKYTQIFYALRIIIAAHLGLKINKMPQKLNL